MSGIHLTVPVLQAHTVGVSAIDPSVAAVRTMATEADAVTVVDGVARLAAPHALGRMAGAFFSDLVADRHADLLDPRSRKGGGEMEGQVDVTLKTSKGIGPSESGRAPVQRLAFYFERLM